MIIRSNPFSNFHPLLFMCGVEENIPVVRCAVCCHAVPFHMGSEQKEAFNQLKALTIKAPIIAFFIRDARPSLGRMLHATHERSHLVAPGRRYLGTHGVILEDHDTRGAPLPHPRSKTAGYSTELKAIRTGTTRHEVRRSHRSLGPNLLLQ